MAFPDDWNYYKIITVNGTTDGAKTHYQMMLPLSYDWNTYPEIDTTHDSTAQSGWAFTYAQQTKALIMEGLVWLFYIYSSGNFYYITSKDGVAWSSPTELDTGISAASLGATVSTWYDGTYFYYVEGSADDTTGLHMRRGTPSSDGTISWSAARQEVIAAVEDEVFTYAQIFSDSGGYVWITYCHHDYQATTNSYAKVTKSSTTDGTWSTASGFPYTLSDDTDPGLCIPKGVSLGSSNVLVVYVNADSTGGVESQLWNGSSWGSETQAISGSTSWAYCDMVADGGNAHLIAPCTDDGSHWYYAKYTGGSGWSARTSIGTYDAGMGCICLTGTDSAIAAWIDHSASDQYILGNEMVSGSWSGEVTLCDEANYVSDYRGITITPASGGLFKALIGYAERTATPWNIKAKPIYYYNAGGNCETDFADIRFTESDGETLLNYGIIEESDSEYANVWIDVATVNDPIPASPSSKNMYFYYGNAGASDASDLDVTFDFYDDFPGAAIDGDKWTTVSGTPAVSSSILTLSGSGTDEIITSKVSQQYGEWRWYGKVTQVNYYVYMWWGQYYDSNWERNDWNRSSSTSSAYSWTGGDYEGGATAVAITANTNYTWVQRWVSGECLFARNTTESYHPDIVLTTDRDHSTYIPSMSSPVTFGAYHSGASYSILDIDWVFLRQWCDPEPTWGEAGEEVAATTWVPKIMVM